MTQPDRGKYAELIDAEMWAFIDKTNNFYPLDTASRSITEQREIYNAMCKIFDVGLPSTVTATDSAIDAGSHQIPIRQYSCAETHADSKQKAQVLYFHGGGFVVGGLESHNSICAEICANTGYQVTAVDYRLAPEHKYPAAHTDALTSYRHLITSGGTADTPIILVGDSAGANLAASVAHASRTDQQQPIGQVLIYPGLSAETTLPSYSEHSHAPMLTTEEILLYKDAIREDTPHSDTVSIAPLSDSDFSQLPTSYLFPAQCDPLASDSSAYAAKVNAAGGSAICQEHQGLVHGHLRGRHSSKVAEQAFADIINAIITIANQ